MKTFILMAFAWVLAMPWTEAAAGTQARSPNNPIRSINETVRTTGAPQRRAPSSPITIAGMTFTLTNDFRSIDGSGTHPSNGWGRAGMALIRDQTQAAYSNGTDTLAGWDRPSPRVISNVCAAQSNGVANSAQLTDLFWQWGQFLDHDLTLVPEVRSGDEAPIPVPFGDLHFDPYPNPTGTNSIPFHRSLYDTNQVVRQQINDITAFIDASGVYGSDPARAAALRAGDGSGRLRTSPGVDGDLLPYNEDGLPNAPSTNSNYFLAGDFRANEQVGLTAMHTLFVREHNFWADHIRTNNSGLDGDAVYELARLLVGAEVQAITYNEFLPFLLGPTGMPQHVRFDEAVNPGIANVFSTGAYRFGHTMLSSQLLMKDGDDVESIGLRDAFFAPSIVESNGITRILCGLAGQVAQEIDTLVVDDVRNFLFGDPGSGGFDLASLNIQRGRDHGLPSFNQVRQAYDLPPAASISDLSSDPQTVTRLQAAYGDVDRIDLWVGGLAEDHVPGAQVGETFFTILVDQFRRLRDGDPFFYRGCLPSALVPVVESQTLSVIIRRHTGLSLEEMQACAFQTGETQPDLAMSNLIWRQAADDVMVMFPSIPGAMYRFQCYDGGTNWVSLADQVPSQGWTTVLSDPPPRPLIRWYRIEKIQAPFKVP